MKLCGDEGSANWLRMRGKCLDFSCFKLFGPEGVGAVVGDAELLTVFAPRSTPAAARFRALSVGSLAWAGVCASDARGAGGVSERLLALLNGGAVPEVKSASLPMHSRRC